jgi:hypothetical protein
LGLARLQTQDKPAAQAPSALRITVKEDVMKKRLITALPPRRQDINASKELQYFTS